MLVRSRLLKILRSNAYQIRQRHLPMVDFHGIGRLARNTIVLSDRLPSRMMRSLFFHLTHKSAFTYGSSY
jgi:hypothetical protein